jgi:hypothetical protein
MNKIPNFVIFVSFVVKYPFAPWHPLRPFDVGQDMHCAAHADFVSALPRQDTQRY